MHEDVRLVRDALDGQEDAQLALTRRLLRVVRARVRWVIDSQNFRDIDADDLAQEVWVRLLSDDGRKLAYFDPARGASLAGFVGAVTDREVRQELRRRRAQKRGGHLKVVAGDQAELDIKDQRPDPETLLSARDLASRLNDYLGSVLSARGQAVMRFVFSDGLDAREAAELMGVNVQVVYNWQHKIRTLSREFLERAAVEADG